MQTIILIVHLTVAVVLIGLVLIQRGKGADMGAAFGGGASNTVFGSQGAASFLTRATAVAATIFFATSLSLAYFSGQNSEHRSVTDVVVPIESQVEQQRGVESDVPAMPGETGLSSEQMGDEPK